MGRVPEHLDDWLARRRKPSGVNLIKIMLFLDKQFI